MTDRARSGGGALIAIAAALTLWACAGGASSSDAGSAAGAGGSAASGPAAETAVSTSIRRYAANTDQAVGLAFDNRGRLLYAEKDSGRIVRIARGKKTVLARLKVTGGGEAGLLGLAGDAKGNVYAYYTSGASNCPRPTSGSSGGSIKSHCIWAFKPSSGRLTPDHLVFSSGHPSTASNHVGGGLHFGPDDALYLGLGDLGENDDPNNGPGRAQSLSVPFGKILRLDPARANRGASGNPTTCGNADNSAQRRIEDDRIYACGLRNPYSFTWDTRKRLWALDVGDSCDEVDIIRAGVNYGWQPPRTDCEGSGAGRPIRKVSGTPSGIAVPTSGAAGSWRGDIFYCVFAEQRIVRYDARSRKASQVRGTEGRCGYDVAARGAYLYMSNGENIYRLKIKG